MPHGGRTLAELQAEGVTDSRLIQHAIFEEEQAAQENDAEGITATLVECILNPSAPGCDEVLAAATGDTPTGDEPPVDTSTTTTTDRNVEQDSVTMRVVDSITQTTQQVFFNVPTAEQFLNEFENSFAGFAANAAAAGLGSADVQQMLNPQSGFMQQLFQSYIGEITQRALNDEDPFVLQGQDGQTPVAIGERPGPTTTTEEDRTTETTEETDTTVTEDTRSTTRAEDEAQQRDQQGTTREQTRATGTEESTFRGEETITEELFQRDAIQPIFRLTPTNFFLQQFGTNVTDDLGEGKEARDKFIGILATQIRASAPRIRPRGGSPTSISTRRV